MDTCRPRPGSEHTSLHSPGPCPGTRRPEVTKGVSPFSDKERGGMDIYTYLVTDGRKEYQWGLAPQFHGDRYQVLGGRLL